MRTFANLLSWYDSIVGKKHPEHSRTNRLAGASLISLILFGPLGVIGAAGVACGLAYRFVTNGEARRNYVVEEGEIVNENKQRTYQRKRDLASLGYSPA